MLTISYELDDNDFYIIIVQFAYYFLQVCVVTVIL